MLTARELVEAFQSQDPDTRLYVRIGAQLVPLSLAATAHEPVQDGDGRWHAALVFESKVQA